ncbi:MAG TPA: bifunctional oligoribonuclease/PAP phosphatase NrnA [Solirubrobacteraceae bacterium]
MSARPAAAPARDEVLDEIRANAKFLLVTHEHPDGDALGSLTATQAVLTALGKDAVMFVDPDEFPLPYEYRFLSLDGLVPAPPADAADRVLVFLDCGNIDRNPVAEVPDGATVLNIDHHHDNTRFGTVNHVDPDASCTAEIVWDLMRELGVEPTLPIAEALYVGLVTDTGRFMYRNTGPRAHVMAAELIEAGVDAFEVYRRIYEGVPVGKLALLARGLANVERYDDGALTITRLTAEDFAQSGAEESYSEGVVDHLRSLQGTIVAALVRDRLGNGQQGNQKVSLRASDDRVDVSRIAREQGGGGHTQAAGFSTTLGWPELVAFLRAEIAAQLG